MSQPLPRLRMDLDFMPSPVEDRPGLLIRDSYGYSDAILIVPPVLVACLEFFDGEHTELDLKEMLVRLTGQLDIAPVQDQLLQALSEAGFLHNEVYEERKTIAEREFAASAVRDAVHTGTAYPDNEAQLRETLALYLQDSPKRATSNRDLVAIAAPHVSPFGGWQTYGAAYNCLDESYRDRTFVILGTSHYGEPDRFGLTRKPFATPYGVAKPDLSLINELADEPGAHMEDYCHAVEHSIEFQIIFLQHLFGPEVRIAPILCGTFARSLLHGGLPEDNDSVRRFLGRLGEIGAREGKRLMWVLGIDMAHMGARYGDEFAAEAKAGAMTEVEQRDRVRIASINEGDARGFWELVGEGRNDRNGGDDLKWCGSAPVYTFLKAVPGAKGTLHEYEQWNIDEGSVVSFAAMSFGSAPSATEPKPSSSPDES